MIRNNPVNKLYQGYPTKRREGVGRQLFKLIQGGRVRPNRKGD